MKEVVGDSISSREIFSLPQGKLAKRLSLVFMVLACTVGLLPLKEEKWKKRNHLITYEISWVSTIGEAVIRPSLNLTSLSRSQEYK